MKIVIAGGHGQIALLLARRLSSRGHDVTSLIRNPRHDDDVAAHGATAAVIDLESASVTEVAQHLAAAHAVVFAAGAGPNSGAARKDSVDRAAAVLVADAAETAGVPRLIQISAMGCDDVRDGARPEGLSDVFYVYLQAKAAAEDDLRGRDGLDWTILRPGRLTDDAGTGQVELSAHVERGPIPRSDVAEVLSELIETGAGSRTLLELASGQELVTAAVRKFS